jgi:glycerate 2-kinase
MSRAGQILVAPGRFKGSLTALEAAAHLEAGLYRFKPAARIRSLPIADGGDGTLDAAAGAGFARLPVVVSGPTGEQIKAHYGVRDGTAMIELAEASGLRRLPQGRPDPIHASSRGTGDLIRAALDAECDPLVIGLGDSACTDGGAGMLQALGARLLDRRGRRLESGGAALAALHTIDLDGLHPRLGKVRIVLVGDVDNPLLGPQGAAAAHAAGKGATPAEVTQLEYALQSWAELLAGATGRQLATTPGAGAGGGVGFAALAVLDAEARPGVQVILDLIEFDAQLPGTRLVITGEGSLDSRSRNGKPVVAVAAASARYGIPAVAVAGRSGLSPAQVRSAGLRAAYPLTGLEPDQSVCITRAGPLLEELAATVVAPIWLTR